MKILTNIKDKAGILALNKELKSQKRTVAINNFETANIVGFIFDAVNRENYQLSKEFIDYVEKRNTRIFGIAYAEKSDQIAYFPYRNGIDYFGLDEVNWYGKPINPSVPEFLKRKYDILIDLTKCSLFPLHYIFAMTNAKFKITNDSINAHYADFVIQQKNSEKLENYIGQIKHYLEAIQIK